jgi:hypothetical protein
MKVHFKITATSTVNETDFRAISLNSQIIKALTALSDQYNKGNRKHDKFIQSLPKMALKKIREDRDLHNESIHN